ncbi:hypothetical protein A2U01_0099379, partial [Trifolium medium]|nr:hypothetical protein [Trifolium medium]
MGSFIAGADTLRAERDEDWESDQVVI